MTRRETVFVLVNMVNTSSQTQRNKCNYYSFSMSAIKTRNWLLTLKVLK